MQQAVVMGVHAVFTPLPIHTSLSACRAADPLHCMLAGRTAACSTCCPRQWSRRVWGGPCTSHTSMMSHSRRSAPPWWPRCEQGLVKTIGCTRRGERCEWVWIVCPTCRSRGGQEYRKQRAGTGDWVMRS